MSETPAPVPDGNPKPVAPNPHPKASRVRRLWRWARKWTKRVVLFLLGLFLVSSIIYAIYRPFAFRASEKELAAVRAELDANKPGWRFEAIEAAYNERVPPPEKNSFTLVAELPKPKPVQLPEPKNEKDRRNKLTNELSARLFLQSLHFDVTNQLPPLGARLAAESVATDFPATNQTVFELSRSPVGGLRLVRSCQLGLFTPLQPDWADVYRANDAAYNLEIAGVAAVIRQDEPAATTYALAALNAGRAIGEMPRLHAQVVRKRVALCAARTAHRLLAWGDPTVGLDVLQRELIAEADVDWIAAAVRGERAALERAASAMTVEEEYQMLEAQEAREKQARSIRNQAEMRFVLCLSRPYRSARLADALRETTRALAVYDRPANERLDAPRDSGIAPREAHPTAFHSFWRTQLQLTHSGAERFDLKVKAELRATAAALACEQFRRTNRRWPKSLDEIPKSILPTIPTDPFDGKPLRLKLLNDGLVVYSFGANQRDDEGDITNRGYSGELDIGARLWNPAARGLPFPDLDEEP